MAQGLGTRGSRLLSIASSSEIVPDISVTNREHRPRVDRSRFFVRRMAAFSTREEWSTIEWQSHA